VAPVSRMAVGERVGKVGGEGPKLETVVGGVLTVVLFLISRATGEGVEGGLGGPLDQTGGAEFSLLELGVVLLLGRTQVTRASRRADCFMLQPPIRFIKVASSQ
jgi:hypothetical protein